MVKVRYFIVPRRGHWTIRCARRRIGAFADRTQAIGAALDVLSVAAGRGKTIEVLQQDGDGRWIAVAAYGAYRPERLAGPLRLH